MPFRVLTLDGGGSWALVEVRALIRLYGANASGHEVLKEFDSVAANSGGSLVLAGLVENLPLSEIANYFLDQNKRSSIFSPTTIVQDKVIEQTIGFGPKYSAANKLPAIARLLPRTGKQPFYGCVNGVNGPGGKPVHLMIVGFDYDRNCAVFFRSAPASGPGWGDGQPANISLAEAVHASTNAPVLFFDAPAVMPFSSDRFWDGGVTGCNNPALVALVEAVVLGNPPSDVYTLSLGTASRSLPVSDLGAPTSPFESARTPSNLINDLGKLAGAITDDPPDAATFIVHAMSGGAQGAPAPAISRIVRMSPLISPIRDTNGNWKAPGGWAPDQFKAFSEITMDALKPEDIQDIDNYCTNWLNDYAPNQPIRSNCSTFDPEKPAIGYAKFSEAHAAWLALFPRASKTA